MTGHKAKVMIWRARFELFNKQYAHAFDAITHPSQFILPERAKIRITQYCSYDLCTMCGGIGVIGTNNTFQLRQGAQGFFLTARYQRERPDALTIQRKRFGERVRNQHSFACFGELANDRTIFFNGRGKALISQIQERNEIAFSANFHDFNPLVGIQVHTAWVVAAGMQHDDGSGSGATQSRHHAVNVHALSSGIVVGVGFHSETCGFEQSAVVFPAGITDPNF